MSFFVFAMLLLVEAANFLFLIVGWAFVGLASYLLIGYYYERPSAVAAAKKAFVVNVIGDVGMVLAAFLLIRELGSSTTASLLAGARRARPGHRGGRGGGAAAARGRGRQERADPPAHLAARRDGEPDPVSALIHGHMVTAGVYLIVRCNVLYEARALRGRHRRRRRGADAVRRATIAFVQEDIKRVLAWSTVSQIGYMIMAAGLGLAAARCSTC